MKTIPLSLLLSFVVFTLSSCSKSNPTGASGSQQILPLKLGNTWLMQYTVYDTTGAVEGMIYDTATVVTDTVISGVTWYHISSKVFGGGLTADKSDGLWEYTSSTPSLFFKYPANVGDTWNAPMNASSTYQITLESDSASVTVPKGTYTCCDYQLLLNSQPAVEAYLCPGVGFVAIDVYSITKSGRSYKQAYGELTSITLK
jgi:hypothetical protein